MRISSATARVVTVMATPPPILARVPAPFAVLLLGKIGGRKFTPCKPSQFKKSAICRLRTANAWPKISRVSWPDARRRSGTFVMRSLTLRLMRLSITYATAANEDCPRYQYPCSSQHKEQEDLLTKTGFGRDRPRSAGRRVPSDADPKALSARKHDCPPAGRVWSKQNRAGMFAGRKPANIRDAFVESEQNAVRGARGLHDCPVFRSAKSLAQDRIGVVRELAEIVGEFRGKILVNLEVHFARSGTRLSSCASSAA